MGSPIVLSELVDAESGEQLELVACPSCRADDAAPYRVSRDRLFRQPGAYRVVRCRRCEMIYTNPRPTFAALAKHYPGDYFCYLPPESLTGLRGFVATGMARSVTERRMRTLETLMSPVRAGTRVCDVGCSFGELLYALKSQRQCEVVGVDISEPMVARCAERGVRAIAGTLSQAKFERAAFDLVTMTEYLEHEGDPRSVLEECRRITRDDGHLVVEIPSISSLPAKIFGNYWSQLDLPRHLTFFTPETLQRMLSEVGYEVVGTKKLTGSVAFSLLHVFGIEGMGRLTSRDMVAWSLASLLVFPLQPFLPEFMFVVARAR
jgi:ubiquinone/menaquinone biosynthesis C-methylase UbiE